MTLRLAAARIALASVIFSSVGARADSTEFNLRVEPGLLIPVTGVLGPSDGALQSVGFASWVAVDWQFARPVALELIGGIGHAENLTGPEDRTFGHGALGLRLRLFEDLSGYADEPNGNAVGNLWLAAHAGILGWDGAQFGADAALGYEFSAFRPIHVGMFARTTIGFWGDHDPLDVTASVGLSISAAVSSAEIPPGRYGVAEVHIEGLEDLDEGAVRACLGTKRRARFGFGAGDPSCGSPPFSGGRLRIEVFSWTWTDWALFDPSVFERDILRVERWFAARGYYDGRVIATRVDPPEAAGDRDRQAGLDPDRCIANEEHGCEAAVTIRVEEGEPTRVERIEMRSSEGSIDRNLRPLLRGALTLHRGDIFDEAHYVESQEAMARRLADHGYPDATVQAEVKVNAERHEAYLLFHVETGQRAVLGRICVSGYGELPPEPIAAATYLAPGDQFSLAAIDEAQRAIFQLGTLASVEIRHQRHDARSAADDSSEREEAAETNEAAATEAAEVEQERDTHPEQPDYCIEPRRPPPPDTRAVDLHVAVVPGRLERIGIGAGLQIGDPLSFGATSGQVDPLTAQNLGQWDVHALFIAEWRNLLGDMLRLRFEERPRLIFPAQFPQVHNEVTGLDPSFGNRVTLSARWPAFLEPRTSLFAAVSHDYGPLPLYGFFRHELDGRVGLERTFFDGRLYLSGSVRENVFIPDQNQGRTPESQLSPESRRDSTRAFIIEQFATLDLRDDPRNPKLGAYFGLNLQESGWGEFSTWDYFRVTAEARGYVPLFWGVVLAARFSIGAMFIERTSLANDDIYDLDELGPPSQQLQGGGSVSNRGVPPGYLGDVRRQHVTRPRTAGDPDPTNPAPLKLQEIIVSGGTRRWEASLEFRIPLTPDLGLVVFGDVGNVTRVEFDRAFDWINLAVGVGLRYFTVVGPIRIDFALRPPGDTPVLGSGPPALPGAPPPTNSIEPRRGCSSTEDVDCRPPYRLFGNTVDGAIHITLGEAF